MTHPDPFLDGAIRWVRAHSQDGLSDLGHAAVLLLGSSIAALKLWWPLAAQSLTLPLMALTFALSFVIRRWADQARSHIRPQRTGYIGPGTLRPSHLLLVIPLLAFGWAIKAAALPPSSLLILLGCLFGGLQIAKVRYTGIRHRRVTGALTILLGFALAASWWSLLYCVFIGALVEAAISLVVGVSLLRGYLRLPLNQEAPDGGPLG